MADEVVLHGQSEEMQQLLAHAAAWDAARGGGVCQCRAAVESHRAHPQSPARL